MSLPADRRTPLRSLLLIGLVLLLLLGLFGALAARVWRAQIPPVRVLFIGNSYSFTNDLPGLTSALAEADWSNRPLAAATVAVGGATLHDLWEQGQALAHIQQGGWDYVVLQEHSMRPLFDPEGMAADVARFDAAIRRGGARTVLYMTWARAYAPEQQARITAAYRQLAARHQALLAPVGLAWQQARQQPDAPQLYQPDSSHPTLAGSYLAAYVFYAVLYQRSPEGLGQPDSSVLTGAQRARFQQIAWGLVRR